MQGSKFVEYASAENVKRTWVSYGKARDWSDSAQGQGEEFLYHATQCKNIWLPMGVTFAKWSFWCCWIAIIISSCLLNLTRIDCLCINQYHLNRMSIVCFVVLFCLSNLCHCKTLLMEFRFCRIAGDSFLWPKSGFQCMSVSILAAVHKCNFHMPILLPSIVQFNYVIHWICNVSLILSLKGRKN